MIGWLAAFFGMVILDFACAEYTITCTERLTHQAGFWASVMLLCSAMVVTSYVHDPYNLYPATFGAYVGTVLAMRKK